MLDLFHLYPEQLDASCRITGLTHNSQNIKEGFAFIAIRGEKNDGHKFIEQAFQKGAKVAIVMEKNPNVLGTQIVVSQTQVELAKLSSFFYQTLHNPLQYIGITGTDGKTSTAMILQQLLTHFMQTGYIGTNGVYYDDIVEHPGLTTPMPPILHSYFAKMREAQIKAIVMEVSSHALILHRGDYIPFTRAIFTNLSQDHLDFHHTMEAYADAKMRLFNLTSPGGYAIINKDDSWSELFIQKAEESGLQIYTFGIENHQAMIQAKKIEYNLSGMQFTLTYKNDNYVVKTKLLAKFNVSNILAAVTTLLTFDIPLPTIIEKIALLETISGRMELFYHKKRNFAIIVDYAHAPNAIEQVLTFARQMTKGKITVLTGAAGGRDHDKRPLMAKHCVELADKVIFTMDEPHSEDPHEILTDLTKNIPENLYVKINDRKDAIDKALLEAEKDEIILILGRGRTPVIYYDKHDILFNDYEYIRTYIEREDNEK